MLRFVLQPSVSQVREEAAPTAYAAPDIAIRKVSLQWDGMLDRGAHDDSAEHSDHSQSRERLRFGCESPSRSATRGSLSTTRRQGDTKTHGDISMAAL